MKTIYQIYVFLNISESKKYLWEFSTSFYWLLKYATLWLFNLLWNSYGYWESHPVHPYCGHTVKQIFTWTSLQEDFVQWSVCTSTMQANKKFMKKIWYQKVLPNFAKNFTIIAIYLQHIKIFFSKLEHLLIIYKL